ncbi:MAG TPA: phosphodiesterase [Mycobacterium sp.]
MKASDIVALPLGLGSAIRRRRVFHPAGVIANGSLERIAPPGEGLPVDSSEVIGRVSKAIGLPGALPDLIGLAIRIPPQPFAATPWDILTASTGSGRLTRFALRPVTSWQAPMTTLMPLRYHGKYWWIRAQMTSTFDADGLSLDDAIEHLNRDGLEYRLDQACGSNDFEPLAAVRLEDVVPAGPSRDVAFDPTIHSAPDVKLAPEWLTDIRRRAYERSREGRQAG